MKPSLVAASPPQIGPRPIRSHGLRRWILGLFSSAATVALAFALTGCGHPHADSDDHDHGEGEAHGHDHSHDESHEEESAFGATFMAGKGVRLAEETRKHLGVEVAKVTERNLPVQIPLTVQVFGEKHHHHLLNPEDHAGCDTHGSAFLPPNDAARVKPGQPVEVLKSTNRPLHGVVLQVQPALALGESEIVVGVSNATASLLPGEFVRARIHLSRDARVTAIPQSALLRTAEGNFVYVVNGDAYLRTAVKTGAETEGWIEITAGLFAGQSVVAEPAQTLYLIELRATKGGGHSH
jgi:hypothetical protein